jgi:hypothetical protein
VVVDAAQLRRCLRHACLSLGLEVSRQAHHLFVIDEQWKVIMFNLKYVGTTLNTAWNPRLKEGLGKAGQMNWASYIYAFDAEGDERSDSVDFLTTVQPPEVYYLDDPRYEELFEKDVLESLCTVAQANGFERSDAVEAWKSYYGKTNA